MKKIVILVIAMASFYFSKSQSNDSTCMLLNKLLTLADKNKLGELKGIQLDHPNQFHILYYNSTVNFSGFATAEVFDINNDGTNQFAANQSFDDETAMKAFLKNTREKIQSCLKAGKQKFELNDNGEKYPLWWQYKKAKIVLEHYKNSKTGKFSLSMNIEFEPPY